MRLTREARALRLGLRMVNGFSLEGAAGLMAAHAQKPSDSVDDLATRGGLDPRDLKCLAAAGEGIMDRQERGYTDEQLWLISEYFATQQSSGGSDD